MERFHGALQYTCHVNKMNLYELCRLLDIETTQECAKYDNTISEKITNVDCKESQN